MGEYIQPMEKPRTWARWKMCTYRHRITYEPKETNKAPSCLRTNTHPPTHPHRQTGSPRSAMAAATPTYFEKLNDNLIREIVTYLAGCDDAETLTNLAKTVPVATKAAKEARAVIWRRWDAWLEAAPDPSDKHLPELDLLLRDFALSTSQTKLTIPQLPANKRLHVHRRAEQLGFTTLSTTTVRQA